MTVIYALLEMEIKSGRFITIFAQTFQLSIHKQLCLYATATKNEITRSVILRRVQPLLGNDSVNTPP
jgi:hypothetical protein